MKKIIKKINDDFSIYTLDKVNCFERQIANVLELKGYGYGHMYIIIKKCCEFFQNHGQELYGKQLNNILGINICSKCYHINELIPKIKSQIDNNNPILIIGNLKNVFYSNYYMENDYSHLFYVKGYDDDKELIYFFDNTQFNELDAKNEDFKVKYELVRDFVNDESTFSIIEINKIGDYVDFRIRDELIKITQFFIELIMKKSNSILSYFCEQNNVLNKEEFINLPKFLEVAFLEYISLFSRYKLNYNLDCINEVFLKYIKYWKQYVIKNLVLVIKKNNCFSKNKNTKDNYILSIEKELVSELNKIKILIQKSFNIDDLTVEDKKVTLITENNEDDIIKINKNQFRFIFQNKRLYNMWFDDRAPKLLFYQGLQKNFEVKFTINIDPSCTVECFQIGVFLRSGSVTYFAAIDNSNAVVIDMIGKDNLSYDTSILLEHTLKVKFDNDELSMFLDNSDKSIISRAISLENRNDFCFGVCCKTWESPGTLVVECVTEYLKIGDDIIDFG